MLDELYTGIQEWLKLSNDKVIDRRVNELIDAMNNAKALIIICSDVSDANMENLRNIVVNIILDLFMLLHSIGKMDVEVITKMIESIKADIDESR